MTAYGRIHCICLPPADVRLKVWMEEDMSVAQDMYIVPVLCVYFYFVCLELYAMRNNLRFFHL